MQALVLYAVLLFAVQAAASMLIAPAARLAKAPGLDLPGMSCCSSGTVLCKTRMELGGHRVRQKSASHLSSGPIAVSCGGGFVTLALQALCTNHKLLEHEAEWVFGSLFHNHVPEQLAAYVCLGMVSIGSSLWLFPKYPVKRSPPDSDGTTTPLAVPRRHELMKQHKLNGVDYSYMLLNTLCMPGLFYHFVCLMRSWGFDPASPPMFGIYPENPVELLTETLPQMVPVLLLYFVTYEFIYYWWHRAMHVSPTLYKWIHRHHHQQTYPDRAIVDTLNTNCIESQVGLYLQLGTLWAYGLLGVANLAAGIWFFTIAGALSVLSHDDLDRELPLNVWRTDEHHMHHAVANCNYSPYSTLWDRVFGTFRPFKVAGTRLDTPATPQQEVAPVLTAEQEYAQLSELIWEKHHRLGTDGSTDTTCDLGMGVDRPLAIAKQETDVGGGQL